MSKISEESFFEKLAGIPKSAGKKVVDHAVFLYVLLTESDVPLVLKAAIVAALAYLISPIDFVPDFLPGGFLDDLAVMAVVVAEARGYKTSAVKKRMNELLPDWCKNP